MTKRNRRSVEPTDAETDGSANRALGQDAGSRRPPPGLFKGQIWMSDDLDAPLPDDLLRLFNFGDEDDPLRLEAPSRPKA
ncbi:MAG: hypothetical protein U1E45_07660 [Geminicoccaceae bacterium]